MATPTNKTSADHDSNRDPITGEPGSHPVGTGLGAAATGAATGALGGAVGGPIGAAVGAVVGAVAGGLAGKGVAESVDPTTEDAYWKEQHGTQPYAAADDKFEDYHPAYKYGYEAPAQHSGKNWHEVVTHMKSGWAKARGESSMEWEKARHASKAAFDRVKAHHGTATARSV